MSRRLTRISLVLVFLLSSEVWAIGLGDIQLDSALNEPLRAEIELLSATPEELASLSVSLASAETFERYGIDRPFYLHYCTTLLHGPDRSWRNSMDHPRASGAGLLNEPPDVMTDRSELLGRLAERGLDPMAGHAGNTWVDDSIGAVLNKLDELGIAQKTLFVFIADHGSRMKGSLFDFDGTNVPCIIRWPAGVKARSACRELIENIDFAPTFFDLAGADVPAEYVVDGRSLRPLDWSVSAEVNEMVPDTGLPLRDVPGAHFIAFRASQADVRIDSGNTVFKLFGRAPGTEFDTGRVDTVHTSPGYRNFLFFTV